MASERKDCVEHKWIPLLGRDKRKSVPTFLFTCVHCGDLKVGTRTIKISRYRMDMGELPINSVAAINLMNPPTADPDDLTASAASGLIIKATVATNDIGVGAPLYMNSSGQLQSANADTSATSPCIALAIDAGTGADKRVLVHGVFRLNSWNWTTGPGTASLIYLETSTGIKPLTQTKPSATDQVIQPVGWALNANCIYFNPSMIYMTHS
jgi:hypothetical protein